MNNPGFIINFTVKTSFLFRIYPFKVVIHGFRIPEQKVLNKEIRDLFVYKLIIHKYKYTNTFRILLRIFWTLQITFVFVDLGLWNSTGWLGKDRTDILHRALNLSSGLIPSLLTVTPNQQLCWKKTKLTTPSWTDWLEAIFGLQRNRSYFFLKKFN